MARTEQHEKNSKLTMPSQAQPDVMSHAVRLAELMAWARAVSMKQPLTDAEADVQMEEWSLIAQEKGFDALEDAVRAVLRNDSDWFPSVKAIRDRAGLNQKAQDEVEGNAAWEYVEQYIRQYGVDGLPLYRNGTLRYPPRIPERIGYALRQIGGLRAVNNATLDSLPFLRKAFLEAYRLAPIAARESQRLELLFGKRTLLGIPQLTARATVPISATVSAGKQGLPALTPKSIPEPLTASECAVRRALLRQQAASLLAKRPAQDHPSR